MTAISQILALLDERNLARTVGIAHDETRLGYTLRRNTVESFHEFRSITSDYYNYHFSRCISNGGRLSVSFTTGRVKQLLEKAYRRHNGDIVTAFNDAHDGTNGGLRVILDIIADELKEESIEHYVTDVFDQFVARNSWADKVMIIRQFIERCGSELASSICRDQPERYARDYEPLIKAYVEGLRSTSSLFRRL